MTKTVSGLVPFALGLAVYGAVVWWALRGGNVDLGRWLVAGFLVAHGVVHVFFEVPQSAAAAGDAEFPFDISHSWLATNLGMDLGLVRAVALVLVVATVIAFALAGFATVGLLVPVGWWEALVVAASVLSVLLLVVGLDANLVLGFAIDAALLWMVLASAWSPSSPLPGGA